MNKIYQKSFPEVKKPVKRKTGVFAAVLERGLYSAGRKSDVGTAVCFSSRPEAWRGFTLLELLVVVLIIGILAAVALPQYEKAVEKSRAAEALVLVRSIADAEQRYYMANGEYAADINKLDLSFPGTPAVYYSPGFQTKNFICRPVRLDGGWNALAVCNRLPRETVYGIGKLKTGELFCGYYSSKGEKICKAMGLEKTGPSNAFI